MLASHQDGPTTARVGSPHALHAAAGLLRLSPQTLLPPCSLAQTSHAGGSSGHTVRPLSSPLEGSTWSGTMPPASAQHGHAGT